MQVQLQLQLQPHPFPQPFPHPQLLPQPQPFPQPFQPLQPQLPPQLFPVPPQQQHSKTTMMMSHRQEFSFPLLKHISVTSLGFEISYAPKRQRGPDRLKIVSSFFGDRRGGRSRPRGKRRSSGTDGAPPPQWGVCRGERRRNRVGTKRGF